MATSGEIQWPPTGSFSWPPSPREAPGRQKPIARRAAWTLAIRAMRRRARNAKACLHERNADFIAEEAQTRRGERNWRLLRPSRFDLEQLRMGVDVELERYVDLETNVTDDDVTVTARIARARLNEFPDCYSRLAVVEADVEAYWAEQAQRAA